MNLMKIWITKNLTNFISLKKFFNSKEKTASIKKIKMIIIYKKFNLKIKEMKATQLIITFKNISKNRRKSKNQIKILINNNNKANYQ